MLFNARSSVVSGHFNIESCKRQIFDCVLFLLHASNDHFHLVWYHTVVPALPAAAAAAAGINNNSTYHMYSIIRTIVVYVVQLLTYLEFEKDDYYGDDDAW